jgi:SWI/SNF-related matrix-associated actin-dependent regulator 1 of chromatin subfamily A
MDDNLKAIIKNHQGYFDRDLKVWIIPFIMYSSIYEKISNLLDSSIKISNLNDMILNVLEKINLKILKFKPDKEKKKMFQIDYTMEPIKLVEDLDKTIYNKLYNFQKEGIAFGLKKNGRFLLADEMGVGKTIQAIGISSAFISDWPVLVICPSSLKYNWRDEILEWLQPIINHDRIQIISTAKDELIKEKDFFIISYDLSIRMEAELLEKNFQFIIADEAHYIKSREAKRSKILMPIMQRCKRLIFLSGTPILSKPVEIYNIVRCLRPDIFDKFIDFSERYCEAKKGPFGWDYSGASNIRELNYLLNSLMIRRLKKDVLQELPPKKRQKVPISTDETVIRQIKILLKKNKKSEVSLNENNEDLDIQDENSAYSKAYSLTGKAKLKGIHEYLGYLIDSKK